MPQAMKKRWLGAGHGGSEAWKQVWGSGRQLVCGEKDTGEAT